MVDVLFADSITAAGGNTENSFKKPFQPVTLNAYISRNYRSTFANGE